MPFPVPGLADIRDKQLQALRNQLPGEDVDTGTDSDYGVRATAVAGVADGQYQRQSWIIRQIFADTADSDYLELHARTRNVYRKNATGASGTATITGTKGKVLPAGAEMRGGTADVVTTETATIGEDGTALVNVKSTATGAATNLADPASVILISPPQGINSAATINALAGGTDKEKDASLLARYLDILRRPPAGGNKYDFKRWALEIDGVTSAYVAPLRRGLGTVDVAITSNNDLPPQELVDRVRAHIEDVRPVTAKDTLVLAPTKKAVDFTIQVSLSGLTLEQARPLVQTVVTDFMNRLEPGQSLILSQLETQISLIPGITDREIISPAQNVTAVIDKNTWEWLRPGTINVELIK